ncbi:MAG: hypothetical protein IJB67_01855 [Firmicutes bacterium]|nr:hypothetical protein [Bacillota bacterium]
MAIKNYTTRVDVYTSLGEIQGALAKNGACKLMIDYDGAGRPIGLMFAINSPINGMMLFSLPAQVDGVLAVFAKQKIKPDRAQAERTAWRNVRDWVLAQMAFIEAGNATLDEIFLPYLTNKQGETLYQMYTNKRLLLDEGGRADANGYR